MEEGRWGVVRREEGREDEGKRVWRGCLWHGNETLVTRD